MARGAGGRLRGLFLKPVANAWDVGIILLVSDKGTGTFLRFTEP